MNITGWRQINVLFTDWTSAELIAATDLVPILQHAYDDGLLTGWFFVRKTPCWRIRYLPGRDFTAVEERLHEWLTELTSSGRIAGFHPVIYEPELHAFGGPAAMDVAHRLFHHDSRHLLAHLATTSHPSGHRRELAVLLCGTLLRAAGLDWYEQGDVWARVADHRPPDRPLPADRIHALEPALRHFLLANGNVTLAHVPTWPAAFTTAGQQLADLADTGRLHRGLRAILAHHVIFTWNRHGLPYPAQTTLAHTARHVVFGHDPTTEGTTSS